MVEFEIYINLQTQAFHLWKIYIGLHSESPQPLSLFSHLKEEGRLNSIKLLCVTYYMDGRVRQL